jgi:hypothetical protein
MSKARSVGQFKVYKRIGAAQIKPIYPQFRVDEGKDAEYLVREGTLLIEAAPGVGEKEYNWEEKISFSLATADVAKLLSNLDAPPELVHSPPDSSVMKTLLFKPGEGKYAGTYMMNLRETNTSTKKTRAVSVPFDAGEFALLTRILVDMVPKLLGW